MEVIYSATTSAWIGITSHNGGYSVVDDSYEYADCVDRATIFKGTYKECRKFADDWYATSTITW